jgi:hypothetical protein
MDELTWEEIGNLLKGIMYQNTRKCHSLLLVMQLTVDQNVMENHIVKYPHGQNRVSIANRYLMNK